MSTLTHLTFEVMPDGRVECHYKYADGSLTTFDTAQLPEKVAPLVADLAAAQQARLAVVEPVAAMAEQALVAKEAAEAEVVAIRDELIDVRGKLIAAISPTDSAQELPASAAEGAQPAT